MRLARNASFIEPVLRKTRKWLHLVVSLRLVNSYGLFTVMTTRRPEIVLEGSQDAENWQAYEFKYKAGDLKRCPPVVAPHQPRLDWQMWFAALGTYPENPWLLHLIEGLLEGAPEILKLLARNPFQDLPPRFIRAVLYDYRFSTGLEKSRDGVWWRREYLGLYLPPVSLDEHQREGATGAVNPLPH
jgi:hypothetical protein